MHFRYKLVLTCVRCKQVLYQQTQCGLHRIEWQAARNHVNISPNWKSSKYPRVFWRYLANEGCATAPKWSKDGRTIYFTNCFKVDFAFDCQVYAARLDAYR